LLAALVARRLWRATPVPASSRWESPLVAARRQAVADALAQRWNDETAMLCYAVADWVRRSRRSVDELRQRVGRLGPRAAAIEAAQGILAYAARLETFTYAVEAALDDY